MLISDEFYQQLNPSYQKMIDELEEELSKGGDFKEYLIQAYSMEYLIPKEYWDFVYSVPKNYDENFWKKEISERSYYHFYWNEVNNSMGNRKRTVYNPDNHDNPRKHLYLLKFKNKYKYEGGDLYYPNIYLKEAFREYEKNLNDSCAISK